MEEYVGRTARQEQRREIWQWQPVEYYGRRAVTPGFIAGEDAGNTGKPRVLSPAPILWIALRCRRQFSS
jgi:hypothetical protein